MKSLSAISCPRSDCITAADIRSSCGSKRSGLHSGLDSFLVSCSVVLASYVFVSSLSSSSSSFLLSLLGLLSPSLHTWLSLLFKSPPPDFRPFCPSTSLCSGDSPEQRSAAAWQRASLPLPSLSGDHQWDLHPCACAKLAGGLPQSHTCHYGVCVASPSHPHLFPPPSTVSLSSSFFVLCLRRTDFSSSIGFFQVLPSLLFWESRIEIVQWFFH